MSATLASITTSGAAGNAVAGLSGVDAATARKIQKSAQEFEGILVRQMLRELRESPFSPEADILSKSYRDLGDDQLATHVAQVGGFGFGKAMSDLMLRQILQSTPMKTVATSQSAADATPRAESPLKPETTP